MNLHPGNRNSQLRLRCKTNSSSILNSIILLTILWFFKHLESTFSMLISKRFIPYATEDKEKNKFRKIVREKLFQNQKANYYEYEIFNFWK